MSALRRMLPLLAVLPGLGGCGGIFTELDEPSVCKTVSAITVPGVPAETVDGIVVPLSLNLKKELGNTNGAKGLVEVTSVVLTAVSGITDFSFLTQVETDLIVVGDGGGGLVTVAAYDQPTPYTPTAQLSIPGNGSNVFAYVKSGIANVQLALTGTPPTEAWVVDAEICVHITVED